MNVELLNHNGEVIQSEIQSITGTYPNQVRSVEALTTETLQGEITKIFHAMYCDHMLHDRPQRGPGYSIRYEDGTVEDLEFVDPSISSGQPANSQLKPLKRS